jgi:putative nucleotidyltransferase with HDIG domain
MQTENQQFPEENFATILLRALELRNRDIAGHSCRVSHQALSWGQALGLGEHDLALLRIGSLLHDIGTLGIPDVILLKPGALTEEERNIIRRHPVYGAELVSSIPSLQGAVPIIKYHHERWDGTGYPDKLKGEGIPLLARVCSIIEVFDTLMSDQIYRRAQSQSQTLQLVEQESGRAFDPEIAAALIKIMRS